MMYNDNSIILKNEPNKKYTISVKGICFFTFNLIMGILCFFIINNIINKNSSNYSVLTQCTIITVSFFIIQFLILGKYYGKMFSNYSIFILMFIIFHFGLFFVYSLGQEYDYFYLMQYEPYYVIKTLKLEFLCVEALFLAGTWIRKIKPFKFKTINSIPKEKLSKTSMVFFIITGIVAYGVLGIKVINYFSGNYKAVRDIAGSLPATLSIIDYLFIPFSVFSLIYDENTKRIKLIQNSLFVWSLITAFCGDRTRGLAGIISILIINTRYKKQDKSILKKYIIVFIVFIIISFLIVFIKYNRIGRKEDIKENNSIVTEVFGELGGSFLPVTLTMRICPAPHNFLYGSSYLFSTIAGLIPSSIDFTDLSTQLYGYAIKPLEWIETDYNYSFGVGYSLCAESYANFGMYGFVAIFLIGLLIIKLLATNSDNTFSKYIGTIMTYEFFTLPRRNYYYIFNHSLYCIVIVSILLILFTQKKKD